MNPWDTCERLYHCRLIAVERLISANWLVWGGIRMLGIESGDYRSSSTTLGIELVERAQNASGNI